MYQADCCKPYQNVFVRAFKWSLFSLFILSEIFTNAQTIIADAFERFAAHQDSLFQIAYENRDAETYQRLLTEFENRYKQLNAEDKETFASHYYNACYNLSCTYALLNAKQSALDNLEKAIKACFYNYAHIQQDSDLNMHARPVSGAHKTASPNRRLFIHLKKSRRL